MDESVRSKKSSRLNPKKEEKVQFRIDSSWTPGSIDIVIQLEDKLDEVPKILKGFKIYYTSAGDIVATYLLNQLKDEKYLKEDTSLSFFDGNSQIYIYGFLVPKDIQDLPKETIIKQKFIKDNTLKIKVRNKKKIVIEALIDEQRERYDEVEQQKTNKGQKEKKIGEVVEKVALWRKFYTGFYDQAGNYIQKPLESAAQEVGIAKKTLDDYLLQIRNGKKYGFNFNQKYNSKIGELRAFVRDEKKKEGGK